MRDDTVEVWLAEMGVASWDHVDEVELGAIDERASLRNQARIVALDGDVVERYEADMRAGDLFPPIICRRVGERLVVLGGNHRHKAARATSTPLAAYVIGCDDDTALRISLADNRRHGLPPTDAERVAQARHLVASGHDLAAAARLAGVSTSKVTRAIRVDEFTRRSRRLGVARVDSVVPSVKARLMDIRSDPAFAAVAELVRDAQLPSGDAFDLVTEVNRASSDVAAVDLVNVRRVEHTERIVGGKKKPGPDLDGPRAQLVRWCSAVQGVRPEQVAAATPREHRRDVLKALKAAVDHLAAIGAELNRR